MNWIFGLRAQVWQFANGRVGTALLMYDGSVLLHADDVVAGLDYVYAVRRDWRDGTHELLCPRRDERRAARALAGDAAYWRPGPLRPQLSLVALTLAEFRSHPANGSCRSTACPTEWSLIDSAMRQ